MYTFIWLHRAPGTGHGTLDSRWGTLTPRCGVWGLVLCPGIEPRLSALGVWSLSHWTPRAVPVFYNYNFLSEILILIYSLVGQILSSRVQMKGPWALDCLHSWMLENACLSYLKGNLAKKTSFESLFFCSEQDRHFSLLTWHFDMDNSEMTKFFPFLMWSV